MSEPFLAEIKIVGFNFAPRGWAFCDGQILPINQNQSLYSLLGTTFGGDGRTSFALPDLRGRTPIHVGDGHNWGNKTGQEAVNLTAQQIPSHTHGMKASTDGANVGNPTGSYLSATSLAGGNIYSTASDTLNVSMAGSAIANSGGQSHDNMQPFLTLGFVIALQGLFPSRN